MYLTLTHAWLKVRWRYDFTYDAFLNHHSQSYSLSAWLFSYVFVPSISFPHRLEAPPGQAQSFFFSHRLNHYPTHSYSEEILNEQWTPSVVEYPPGVVRSLARPLAHGLLLLPATDAFVSIFISKALKALTICESPSKFCFGKLVVKTWL